MCLWFLIAAMSFLSKTGSMLRQTVSKHIKSEIYGSNPSVFQMIRCMSSSKLFIGGGIAFSVKGCYNPIIASNLLMFLFLFLFFWLSGLSYGTDETSLREAFNKYGDVVEGIYYLTHDFVSKPKRWFMLILFVFLCLFCWINWVSVLNFITSLEWGFNSK